MLRDLEYSLNRFHDKQEEAWYAYRAGLDLVLDWGRRSGKSDFVAEVFIEDVETYGKDCLYVALTKDQSRDIMWQKFESRLNGNPDWKLNQQRLQLTHIPSNGVIALKGSDLGKDRLRGSGKRLIALDEFAFYKDPSIVKEVFIPQIADFNGQMFYLSSTKGKNHFWKLKNTALKNQDRYYTSKCTVYENPFVSLEGRNKLLAEYSGKDDLLYRQEILAEYVDFNGLVFALPQDSYIEKRWDEADLDHSYHWRGLDHGFSPDPTACVWIAYNPRKGYFQVYAEYKQAQLLIHKHSEIINKLEKFRIIDTISDVHPQIVAEYEAVGLACTPANKYDKESRMLRIVNALKKGSLKIAENCKDLLDEMLSYEWGSDGNDHLIDALNYGFTNLVIPEQTKQESTFHSRKVKMFPGVDSFGSFDSQDFGDF